MLAEQARLVLDSFGVPARLQHVRRYVWREGTLRFRVETVPGRGALAFYELEAHWSAPRLDTLPSRVGLVPASQPTVDGRWTSGTTGYLLWVGIDLAVPSAIFIHSRPLQSFVPFLGRPREQVEHALHTDLTAYVNAFLRTSLAVPEARAAAARGHAGTPP